MNTTEFCKLNKITIKVFRTKENPYMSDGDMMDHWKVTLKREGKQLTTYFSKFYGIPIEINQPPATPNPLPIWEGFSFGF